MLTVPCTGDERGDDELSEEEANQAMDDGEQMDTDAMSQDELLNLAFLMALKKSVKDSKLPMLVSEFSANHLLPCRPVGTTLDVKKTSFKKIGKFLVAMADEKHIRLQDQKGAERLHQSVP